MSVAVVGKLDGHFRAFVPIVAGDGRRPCAHPPVHAVTRERPRRVHAGRVQGITIGRVEEALVDGGAADAIAGPPGVAGTCERRCRVCARCLFVQEQTEKR